MMTGREAGLFLEILMLEARDVGKAVEELRGERSMRLLATQAHIDPEALSRIEKGEEMPSSEEFARLCEAFGILEPEADLKIIDHWRRRIGEELPGSLEAKRLELFEHVKVLGLRLSSAVNTLDEMLTLETEQHG